MPFQDGAGGYERASALGHVHTIQHPLVQGALSRYQMPKTRTPRRRGDQGTSAGPADPGSADCDVQHAVATDGSYHEAEVDPNFPSTRVLFMQMGAVIVDLKKLATRSGPFVDPGAILDAQSASVMASMLPSIEPHRGRHHAEDRLPPGDRRDVPHEHRRGPQPAGRAFRHRGRALPAARARRPRRALWVSEQAGLLRRPIRLAGRAGGCDVPGLWHSASSRRRAPRA